MGLQGSDDRVLIAGAGPAGTATALLLARAGIPVSLVERETGFDRVFRGEGLMPLGIDALQQMGLREALESLPGRRLESWDIYIDRQFAFRVPEPMDELGDRAVRVVSQPALLGRIVAEARQYSSFQFAPGTIFRDLLWDGPRAVGARLQTPDGPQELAARLIIGCDGRHSTVRKKANLELSRIPEHYDVLWFKLAAPAHLRGRSAMYLMVRQQAYAAVCYTSWDDRLQYGLALPKGAYQDLRDSDWMEAAAAPAPEWLAEHLWAHRDQVDGPLLLNVIVGRALQWTVPGVLLIGDAAHPMSPVRAQGINAALRDAIVTANWLVPALQRNAPPRDLDVAARAVQAEREPEIIVAQKLQLQQAQGQEDARRGSWRYSLARALAPRLGQFAWAQRAWLSQQQALRFGSTEVRLQV